MNQTLSDKKTMDNILMESRDIDEVYKKMGYLLSYHVSTRSSKAPTKTATSPYAKNGYA